MEAATVPADWREWPAEQKHALLVKLRDKLQWRWEDAARPNQLAPVGEWGVWLILAGRGWGKTRTGAEFVAGKARAYPGARVALVGQTFSDGRDTMVEGESGLLSVLADHELRGGDRDLAWNRSMGELYMANGSRFKVFSSEKPNRLRGPQHHFAWGDEPATWEDAHKGPVEDTTWANLEIGCRLSIDDSEPQIVLTGTPKPVRLLTRKDKRPMGLLHRESVVVTRGHTEENIVNLDSGYRERVIEPLRGTRAARQELAAELLEDVEGALWLQSQIDADRVFGLPHPAGQWQQMPVVGVDPSDGNDDGAENAYTVVALGVDHRLYVLESEGMRGSRYEFACAAIDAAKRHRGRLVIEKNHGGGWLVDTFNRAMRERDIVVPLEPVSAAQGKRTRAEPAAALYETGRVSHVGEFVELEEQLTSFTGAPNEASPDRLDSLVWAMSKFTGHSFKPATSEDQAVHRYTDRPVAGVVRWGSSF